MDVQARRAAVYCRISQDRDHEALGVARQEADCRQVVERYGWELVDVYVDNDVSAYTRKRRPNYERMLDDVARGTVDAVVVYHADRLTRRPAELEEFVQVMEKAKAIVRFVRSDVDISTGDGLMILRIMGAVAANESATKSRRITRKRQEEAEQGKPHHGGNRRPFGFEEDRITHRPHEAQAIRDAAARYLAGESLRSLCTWLDDHGVETVTGSGWRTPSLGDLLRSPRIAGLRTHKGQVIGPGQWQPIITTEQRDQILARTETRKYTGERSVRTYLLTGLLRCAHCGTQLYARPNRSIRKYACIKGPDHRGCGRMSIVADPLEALISQAVLIRLDSPHLTEAMAGRASDATEAARLSTAIDDDRTQLDALAVMFATKEISASEWRKARQIIDNRLSANQRRLRTISNSEALNVLSTVGTDLAAKWESLDISRQQAIVKAVIDHIVIRPLRSGPTFNPKRVEPIWRL